jgi:hypothetical protein
MSRTTFFFLVRRALVSVALGVALGCNQDAIENENAAQAADGPGLVQSCYETSSSDGQLECFSVISTERRDIDGDGENESFVCFSGDEDGDGTANIVDADFNGNLDDIENDPDNNNAEEKCGDTDANNDGLIDNESCECLLAN